MGREFQNQIATLLADEGFDFDSQVTIGGLRPDFVVNGPHGRFAVVETKVWDPRGGNTARAVEQVERYRKATGADRAFLVFPYLKRNRESEGVVSPQTLVSSLRTWFEETGRRSRRTSPKRRPPDGMVFAAMPFDREYDDTYLVAMSHAAEQVNAACERVDRTEFSGDVVEEIKRLIRDSLAVIVDLSEAKPNVLYEAGYAHALDKPTVHICSTSLSELPFDVRNWNTISYNRGQTAKLRAPLTRRLKSVLA